MDPTSLIRHDRHDNLSEGVIPSSPVILLGLDTAENFVMNLRSTLLRCVWLKVLPLYKYSRIIRKFSNALALICRNVGKLTVILASANYKQ